MRENGVRTRHTPIALYAVDRVVLAVSDEVRVGRAPCRQRLNLQNCGVSLSAAAAFAGANDEYTAAPATIAFAPTTGIA